jgi:hypothetical protein
MSVGSNSGGGVSHLFTYHEIAPLVPRYLYSVSAAQFANHVKCIVKMNSLETSTAGMARVTFDDGHISQFEYALPVLELSAMKAIFFVTAGWIGARPGFMSWGQLAKLSALGHEVQSHGWSHALLTQCSDCKLEDELARSKKELESHLGTCVDAISAPGGRWNSRVLRACARVGYRRVFVSDPWLLHKEKLGANISGRWMVTRHMDEGKIAELLQGKGVGLKFLRVKYLVKESAKAALGDRAYQSLWRSFSRKRESLEGTEEKADSARG